MGNDTSPDQEERHHDLEKIEEQDHRGRMRRHRGMARVEPDPGAHRLCCGLDCVRCVSRHHRLHCALDTDAVKRQLTGDRGAVFTGGT